jgi:hypothetical protein
MSTHPHTRRWLVPGIALLLQLVLAAFLFITPRGYTAFTLTDLERGRTLLSVVMRNGEPMTLTWQNSIYQLPVEEVFYAEDGRLVLDKVAFLDPTGVERSPVTADDVKDLYHTGGPFSASGMDRPYEDVIFRIGEIGDPKVTTQGRTVALKAEVGFGGRVRLQTHRPNVWEIVRR